jgi:uroporphyrinogen decarboxylase
MPKIKREPNFERLTTTLLNQRADAVPLIELGIDPSIKEKILGRKIDINSITDEIEFMTYLGYDYIKVQPRIQFELDRQIVATATASQNIEQKTDRAWSSEHKGLISNWEEFEKYPWPKIEDIDYSNFERARKVLPDNMGIIGQYGDIFTTAWELMGFETFAMAIYEQPDLINAIFKKLSDLILNMFDTMADMDWVGTLWYSDDIAYSSGLMVNPEFFRSYFFPQLKYIGHLCKKRSIPFIYHTDGVLWEVMNDIIESGVSALHPIEPKSMDIYEVNQKVGEQLCLCGGIEVDLLSRGNTIEATNLVRQYIGDIAANGGYCVGSSNSIPDYVNVENYLAMVEATLRYGVY